MKNIKKTLSLLLLLVTFFTAAQSQTRSIQGFVTDENGESVLGASVLATDTKIGSITNEKGYFILNNIPANQESIKVSFIGYVTQTVNITGKLEVRVQLQPSDSQLNDVVAIGYGTQKKAHLTGAVATIDPEDIKDLSGPSLAMSLRGLVPGVSVSGGDSRPGSTARINIRQSSLYGVSTSGFSSYTGPLYVIDGFIAEDELTFNNLDPDMIENISILKDAAAAVYGSRAANGVILVNTKKGKVGAPKISYSGQFGYTDEISRTELMDAYNQGLMYNIITAANPVTVAGWDNEAHRTSLFQSDELEHMKTQNYNLLDKYWTSAITQRHSVNVSGATERVNYFAGISYYTQDGNIGRLEYNRWNYRAGLDAKVGKGFKASLQISGDYGFSEKAYSKVGASAGEGESDYSYLYKHPRHIPEYINGLPISANNISNSGGNDQAYHFDLLQNMNNYNRTKPQNMSINTALEYDFGWISFLKGLKMRMTYSKSIGTSEGNQYATNYDIYEFKTRGGSGYHLYTTPDLNLEEANITRRTISNGNMLRRTMDRSDRYQLNFVATYSRNFGLHNVSGLFTIEKAESEYEDLSGQLKNPYLFTNYQSSGAPNPESLTDIETVFSRMESGSLSYAGRVNYAYNNKYLAEFLVRVDASTKFHPDNYWGVFPAASAGWVLSEEDWFRNNIKWLDFFKFRTSFGLTGRDNIAPWQWLMTYGLDKDKGPVLGTEIGGLSGSHISIPDAVPNRDAHWDSSYKSNFGIDANALNNKLGVGLDVYYNWNRDIFMTAQGSGTWPSTVGAAASAENIGSKDDWGIELSLNWRDKITKDLKYSIGLNLGYSDNRTLEGTWPSQFLFNSMVPGQWASTNPSWGYECIGMFRNYQEIEEYFDKYQIVNYCGLTKENVHPGMLIYNDIRGSYKGNGSPEDKNNYYAIDDPADPKRGYVDGNDMVKINNDSRTWGFTTNAGIDWKGLQLKFQLAASWGGYDMFSSNLMASSTATPAYWTGKIFSYQDVTDGSGNIVVHQNRDAKYPNPAFGLNSNASTFWRRNGASITLRNITLAYAVPKKITKFVGIESCRINVTGQNMLTILSPYPRDLYDPMSGSLGNYPNLRRITVGLNVSF
ncbi:MAG: TonB-dependent receptor [Paludibacter sp.]|jgi:TonB-linked SusC/RagA family outer membrane protein|nr:TonB-dependent receptor [Paludibacter sp.]